MNFNESNKTKLFIKSVLTSFSHQGTLINESAFFYSLSPVRLPGQTALKTE